MAGPGDLRHQFGGICAWTVAWQRPDAVQQGAQPRGQLHEHPRRPRLPGPDPQDAAKPIRVFLHDGSGDLDNEHGNWPLANQEMAAALKFARYDYQFVYGDGGHNGKHGGAILPDSLRGCGEIPRVGGASGAGSPSAATPAPGPVPATAPVRQFLCRRRLRGQRAALFMAPILSGQSLTKSFGSRPLFVDISLELGEGDRVGLIGPNGAGKSTLLNILAGREPPDAAGKQATLALLAQEDSFPAESTVHSALRGPGRCETRTARARNASFDRAEPRRLRGPRASGRGPLGRL